MSEKFDTIVIGAGQAGLAAGYHLSRTDRSFVILEGADQVGGSWQSRWDSMKLFTPASHDGLPGMPFPGGYSFPTAREMAAYLQRYAQRFALPVRTGVRVDGLFRENDRYTVTAGLEAFTADSVIIATGAHRHPRVPEFAADLDPAIVQLHSSDYRNPGQLREGTVLVVGAGNSGADIGVEVARTHRTLLSGRHPGELPLDINTRHAALLFPAIWWAWTHVLTERTPMGRKVQAEALEGHGDWLIRLKPKDIDAAGITRKARIAGADDGMPRTEDGELLEVANVIWCTGFQPDFGWISLPGLAAGGRLPNQRGRVEGQPGLYVLGQEFQYMFNSQLVGGVGRDAEYAVNDIVRATRVHRRALQHSG